MVNYVVEGMIAFMLSDPAPEAQWLRSSVEFLIVPFVDKDGVEDGDQGKNRRPRDHGRDYLDESIHPSTRALREMLPAWSDGRLAVALDLHCPHISGKHNEVIYLVGSPDERIAREQQAFSRLLELRRQGGLPFFAKDFLPFGVDWNNERNYQGGEGFARWASELPGIRLATSI